MESHMELYEENQDEKKETKIEDLAKTQKTKEIKDDTKTLDAISDILDPNDLNLDINNEENPPVKYLECFYCHHKEKYEYFGRNPPFFKKYKILEDSYVIEDPFQAQKQGEILILGTHCIRCQNLVCKDSNCSVYFDGTYCVKCAKNNLQNFPDALKEKLNRIILKN